MTARRAELQAVIAALESQRALLGAAIVETALAPLRRELSQLQAEVPAQQLKQVSVLFVDVVGSTAMGQRLDPEAIHAVMDSALERFTAAVQAHHGRVLQYTGDGMLAAFGTVTAGEEDATDAVRAGLDIVAAAHDHAPRVRTEFGVADFNVRAGIHTGRVLLGGGMDAQGSIRGATLNIAARMEQSAPVGRLRISHDTWRLVRGLFDMQEQAPIQVKGVDEPLRSWLVGRERPRALRVPTRGIEGMDTRMVGRNAELAALCQALDDVAREGRSRAVTVLGEAGLGKSRLLLEFQNQIDPVHRSAWLLASRADPRSASRPYGQLRDVLCGQLQITEGDAPQAARDKLQQGLMPLLPEGDEARLHALGQLIGFDFSASPHLRDLVDDEARLRALGFDTARHCLRRLAVTRAMPLVLVFDDLHWADDGSIAFVQHLLADPLDTPLLCLMLARPLLLERQPGWASGAVNHACIPLRPLDSAGSRELADVLLQRMPRIPDTLRAVVTGGAEGNPFYMEELVKMLLDDGVIVVAAEGWSVLPDRLAEVRVPPTLVGVLQARLDALAAGDRRALQQAAVVGHVFGGEALAAIEPEAMAALPALLRRQLVIRREAYGDAGEYAFQHHLLHQVTYDSVLKEPRRQGHERVGAFWSERAEVRNPQAVTPRSCHALLEACEHRRHTDIASLARWFDGQFTSYLNAFAHQTLRPLAHLLVQACEQQLGPDHEDTARALTNLGRVSVQRREMEVAEPALRRALSIQEQALGADHPDTARTLAVLGGCFMGRGDYASAEPLFRRAHGVRARALGAEHALTLATLRNLAFIVKELGQLEEAESMSRHVLQALEHSAGVDAPETARARTSLGEVLVRKGDPAAAEPLLRHALAAQQACLGGHHPEAGTTMWHLAEALRTMGRPDEAEPLARLTLYVWEKEMGPEHEWTAWALGSLAEVCLAQRNAAETAALAERALVIHRRNFGQDHAQVAAMWDLLARARRALAASATEGNGEAGDTARTP